MGKRSKYILISEFCEINGIKINKFYRTLHRHPELARKIRTSTAGERMLDEKSAQTVRAIFRNEKSEDKKNRSAYTAAGEINILTAEVDELRIEVSEVRCENRRLKKYIDRERSISRKYRRIADAVFKILGREYLHDDEKRIADYLENCDDFKIYMNSKFEKEDLCDEEN